MINIDLDEIMKNAKVYPINKAVILDHVNYYGLVQNKQIMFCTRDLDRKVLLWCKKQEKPRYSLSPAGESYLSRLPEHFHSDPSYIGEIELFRLKSNKIDFWNCLFAEGLYPFWCPVCGPYAYFQSLQRPAKIALCKIFKIDLSIAKGIRGRGQDTYRELTEQLKVDIEKALETKTLINSGIYEKYKNRILRIIKQFE